MQKLILTLLIPSLLFPLFTSAQGENDNWIFGSGAWLSFSQGGPKVMDKLNTLVTLEGCTSVSSRDGKLLFYSDGTRIWDRMHRIMEGGTGLMGHRSSTSSSVVVPFPGHSGQYYVFCVEANFGHLNHRFSYNIVDMNQNGGMGKVMVRNKVIMAPSDEKIAVTRHCNTRDFWIVVHEALTNIYHAYLLSSAGLSKTSVVSSTENSKSDAIEIGYLKFSPDGQFLVNAIGHNQVLEICTFNKKTGRLYEYCADRKKYVYGQSYYGVAFSASSRMLYVSFLDQGTVYQYDLEGRVDSIFSKRKLVYAGRNRLGALQLARDQRIYVSNGYSSRYIHCITEPEKPGDSCLFSKNHLTFPSETQLGLPTYVESAEKYFSLGKDSVIDLDEYTLSANIMNARYLWSTGETSRSITVYRTGSYSVTVYDRENCLLVRDTIHIRLLRKKIFILPPDTDTLEVCGGDTVHSPVLNLTHPDVKLQWTCIDSGAGPLPAAGTGHFPDFKSYTADTVLYSRVVYTPYKGQVEGQSVTLVIRVNPRPVIHMSHSGRLTQCGGRLLGDHGIVIKPSYTNAYWQNNNLVTGILAEGELSDLAGQQLKANPFDTFSFIRINAELNACRAEPVIFKVTVMAIPYVIPMNQPYVCQGDTNSSFLLTSLPTGSRVFWHCPEKPGFLPDSGKDVIPGFRSPRFPEIKEISIRMYAERMGCRSGTSGLTYTLLPAPEADFSFDTGFFQHGQTAMKKLRFTNLSRDAAYYSWQFGDGFHSEEIHPVHEVNRTQPFRVLLIAENIYGCMDTAYWNTEGYELHSCYVPNAFHPGSRNGNHVFRVYGNGAEHAVIKIWNRWGELLYETEQNEGWDGTYRGNECPQGVYVFTVTLVTGDGTEKILKGTLTLLR